MKLTEIFITRPVMTALLMIGIVLFGVAGYRALPVSDLPNVDFPTIQVSAALPGASPETMATSVATPLERQFATIAGIDSMTSSSGIGATAITIQFTLDRSIDAAAQDVQNAISAAQKKLPPGMPTPPSIQKVNPADQPILFFTLSSPTLALSAVDEYAENLMAQRISSLAGVAQVNVFGAQKWAVHAQLDPGTLAARKIGIDEVEQALAQHNVNLPVGTLWGTEQAMTLKATGQILTAPAFGRMIVDGAQNDKSAVWLVDAAGSERAIGLSIQRQPGTNTVEVVQRIKALLPSFREQIPPSVKVTILLDRSEPILESFNDVKLTLALAVAMVVLVIFLFLRNVSATLIPSLALPISIIGTFAAMNLLGYTLDNLSLMALTLSVGFVVDDAIVVLENIVRHLEMGQSRMLAAIEGAREIGFTVLSMTLSLAAVFIPVLCRDHHGGNCDFGLRLHQPHTHAVQPVSETAQRSAQCHLPRIGEGARRDASRLRVDVARGHAASIPHHARRGRNPGSDHLPGLGRAQRVHSQPGYPPTFRQH
jgi:hydrophobic/amphiphilic exporter-1 (mainly G- bacteria), HAE1 family